ncbi:hypothetical protein CPT07_27685 (plasmid) [Escherichia coli]|nr:hypothetical protein CPT07_27685 [Escherichia coli]
MAATAQHHAAGAATVRTLNAGRICAAVRPCLWQPDGLHPGNAPALRRVAATAQHHAAGAATVRTLNAGRICAAVRPLSVATCRSCIRATRQRCAGWRQRLSIMPLARRRFAP